MYEAHSQYGYTLKDITKYIGIHYTTLQWAELLKKSSGIMKSDIARTDPFNFFNFPIPKNSWLA